MSPLLEVVLAVTLGLFGLLVAVSVGFRFLLLMAPGPRPQPGEFADVEPAELGPAEVEQIGRAL